MKKPITVYQGQIRALRKQREELDLDFAQVLSEAARDGYSVIDLLDSGVKPEKEYDL